MEWVRQVGFMVSALTMIQVINILIFLIPNDKACLKKKITKKAKPFFSILALFWALTRAPTRVPVAAES